MATEKDFRVKKGLYVTEDATVAGNLSVLGNATLTGELRGPALFKIDPAAVGDNTGKVVIAGDLQVDGTTTTINSTTLTIDDKQIVLASGAADAASADGAGILIDGANASITYDFANDQFQFNKEVYVNGNVGIGTSLPDTYGKLAVAGNVVPAGDALYDLGTPTYRWNNVYTTDLHLSNETKTEGNSVDGTTGNWTIQEGADHLYIINNKTNKKYKFALEEIE